MTQPERCAAVLRAIPKVDRLLGAQEFQPLLAAHSREEVVRELRRVLDGLRNDAGRLDAAEVGTQEFVTKLAKIPVVRDYDAFNRRATVTDANGVPMVTAYDALNRVASVGSEKVNFHQQL